MTELDDDEFSRLEKALDEVLASNSSSSQIIQPMIQEAQVTQETSALNKFKVGDKVILMSITEGLMSEGINQSEIGKIGEIQSINKNTHGEYYLIVMESSGQEWSVDPIDLQLVSPEALDKLEEERENRIKKCEKDEQTAVKILTDIFQDNFDYVKSSSGAKFVIHFPTINITNTNGHKHTIKDLFVVWEFMYDNELGFIPARTRFRGFRGSMSIAEAACNYAHSHLPSCSDLHYSFINLNEFCLGTGQPLGEAWLKLRRGFNADVFLSCCLQLEPFLSWESLEGGPYIRISNVINNNKYVEITNDRLLSDAGRTYDQEIIFKVDKLEYELEQRKDFTLLKPTVASVERNLQKAPSRMMLYKDNNNVYYTKSSINRDVRDYNIKYNGKTYTYKGQQINYEIYNLTDDTKSYEACYNPYYIINTVKYLTNLIN